MSPSVQEVVAADGHRFELRRFGPPAGSPPRPGILWLPALGVPAQKYEPLAAGLAAAGIEVVLHEWRGLATSSWRASRRVDWGYRELLGVDLTATLAGLDDGRRWAFAGHSLGAQFAAMLAARHPQRCAGLALVAAGVPYPPTFRSRYRPGLAVLARLMPALVWPFGYFPGHSLKFAGRESAQVMRDWAATARQGRYADYGDGLPMESLLARTRLPALGLTLADDWMAPPASLAMLLGKLGGGDRTVATLDAGALGTAADHFRWMRRPDAVVARIAAWLPVSS